MVIAEVEEGPRRGKFLFDEATVARLDEFYDIVKKLPYKSDGEVSYNFLDFQTKTPGLLLPPKWYRWLSAWSIAIYFKQPLWQTKTGHLISVIWPLTSVLCFFP